MSVIPNRYKGKRMKEKRCLPQHFQQRSFENICKTFSEMMTKPSDTTIFIPKPFWYNTFHSKSWGLFFLSMDGGKGQRKRPLACNSEVGDRDPRLEVLWQFPAGWVLQRLTGRNCYFFVKKMLNKMKHMVTNIFLYNCREFSANFLRNWLKQESRRTWT